MFQAGQFRSTWLLRSESSARLVQASRFLSSVNQETRVENWKLGKMAKWLERDFTTLFKRNILPIKPLSPAVDVFCISYTSVLRCFFILFFCGRSQVGDVARCDRKCVFNDVPWVR